MYFTKKLIYIFVPLLVLLGMDFTVGQAHVHVHLPWDASPGFDALYGIIAAAILVIIAKPLLNLIIERKTEYYDDAFMPSGYAWFDEAINEHLTAKEIMQLEKAQNWGTSDREIEDLPGYYIPDTKLNDNQ